MNKKLPFIFGLYSPIVFFVLLCLLGFLWSSSGYNAINTGMSELGAVDSPYRNFMNFFGFSFLGVSISTYGFGLLIFSNKFKLSTKNRSYQTFLLISSILTIIAGIFLFIVGFLPCDSNCIDVTTTGKLHSFVSTIPAILMPIAAMLSANALYNLVNKKVGQLSFYLGLASLSSGPLMFLPGSESFTGLIQRLGLGLSLVWMISSQMIKYKKQ